MSPPIIELRQVSKRFGPLQVLNNLSVQIGAGEKVVLMGPSGCGKSSLLRCLNGLDWPDSGQVFVLGEEVTRLRTGPAQALTQLRARVGMVFQQYNLFPHLTVLENVILGPVQVLKQQRAEAVETALDLLKRVGIAEKAQAYPDQLSGGQKQRVAIARSLAMKPAVLLLDEPTSALDPSMSREVLRVVQDLAHQEMTLLMVTHDGRFAQRIANRILILSGGTLVEDGPPEQLLTLPRHELTRDFLTGEA
jgi:ABC-type polar amino acid transport system ATPase subunit